MSNYILQRYNFLLVSYKQIKLNLLKSSVDGRIMPIEFHASTLFLKSLQKKQEVCEQIHDRTDGQTDYESRCIAVQKLRINLTYFFHIFALLDL